MGLFTSKLKVWNPADPSRAVEIELWVDTGASYSWISRTRLEALGIRPARRKQFRTIEGRVIERGLAPVFVEVEGYVSGDNVVLAEDTDAEVMGAYTLEGLGLAADMAQQKLVPTVGFALRAITKPVQRRSRVVEAIDAAVESGRLIEPFSNEDFRVACPGFGDGTYNAFLWKHSRGNPGGKTVFFERVGKNSFRRIRP